MYNQTFWRKIAFQFVSLQLSESCLLSADLSANACLEQHNYFFPPLKKNTSNEAEKETLDGEIGEKVIRIAEKARSSSRLKTAQSNGNGTEESRKVGTQPLSYFWSLELGFKEIQNIEI